MKLCDAELMREILNKCWKEARKQLASGVWPAVSEDDLEYLILCIETEIEDIKSNKHIINNTIEKVKEIEELHKKKKDVDNLNSIFGGKNES
jgi:hypothetical protein